MNITCKYYKWAFKSEFNVLCNKQQYKLPSQLQLSPNSSDPFSKTKI